VTEKAQQLATFTPI